MFIMKKPIFTYILLILAGLLLGWLIFGGSGNDVHDHELAASEDVEFTCSMHPQVRQDNPGNCPICGMELIPVSQEGDQQDDDPYLITLSESHYNWANIRTIVVGADHTGATLRLSGRVGINEQESRVITATFPGRIENLYADFTGRYVRQGERLATIYSPEMMQAQQELLQAAANRESQPRLYNAARQRLRLLNITEQQINNIEARGEASASTDVYATLSGFLVERAVSQGDYVATGQTLFSIARLQNVWVELDAYENQLGMIASGQQAQVQIPSQPGASFTGKVEFIDPFINPQTRSARIRLTVQNRDNQLRPGMLVNAVITSEGERQISVPATAVLWTGDRSVVYVKRPAQSGFTFEFREVETGARTGEGFNILSGLSQGEEIAVNGVFAIDAAAQLRGSYSMMSQPAKAALSEPFRTNLQQLFSIYFQLQMALAADDPTAANRYARQLRQQLQQVGLHSLEGEHHAFWMQQYQAMDETLQALLRERDLGRIREHFEPLSAAFIETARTLGAVGQTFYVSFCPMVDGDRGAYWLSNQEEISNPYFGSQMLRCGEVREVIRDGVPSQQQAPRPTEGHVH
jgi:membrane fusion protein, copper/silver efflux system